MRYKLMTLEQSDDIARLRLSSRLGNALIRNHIRTIGELTALSDVHILRMRNVGQIALDELRGELERHGLALAEYNPGQDPWRQAVAAGAEHGSAPSPVRRNVPEWAAGAEWIGRQLDALADDSRVYERNTLGGQWTGEGARLQNRRRAWAWYRWGTEPDVNWPRSEDGGFGFMAVPLPGSMELHMEGLNRLAHEELGDE